MTRYKLSSNILEVLTILKQWHKFPIWLLAITQIGTIFFLK